VLVGAFLLRWWFDCMQRRLSSAMLRSGASHGAAAANRYYKRPTAAQVPVRCSIGPVHGEGSAAYARRNREAAVGEGGQVRDASC